jgi:phosphoglycerate dehydrogenase-like enzyme
MPTPCIRGCGPLPDAVSILIHTAPQPPEPFAQALRDVLREEVVHLSPEAALADAANVETILLWRLAPGLVASFPNLRFLAASAAGVDKILACPDLPPQLPVTRTVDPEQNLQIAQYVCAAILRQSRQQALYDEQQRVRAWKRHAIPRPADTVVGLLGLGESARCVARALLALRFTVQGWSRSPRVLDGVETHHGAEGLQAMLPRCRFLVCLLPLTPQTQGIVDARMLAALPRGAWFINVARGGHVVEADLLAAVRSGQLAGATLDVQGTEPLPAADPLWDEPRIVLTPHVASLPTPRAVAVQLAENLQRARSGLPLLRVADRNRGY